MQVTSLNSLYTSNMITQNAMVPLRQRGSFLGACQPNKGCVLLGNPDFGFCNRTRNPFSDFTFEKSVLRVDFN